jgi:hypothetical protein
LPVSYRFGLSHTTTGSLFIVTYAMHLNGARRTGSYELDLDRMTTSLIVDDILDGQFVDLDRIYECPEDVPRQDVTEDVARLVTTRLRDEHRPLSYAMASWLQAVLGADAVPWPAAAE